MKKISQSFVLILTLLLSQWVGISNLNAQDYSFTNSTNYAIPDVNDGGAASPIEVSGIPVGSEIIDIWVSAQIGHTFVGDLSIWLVSPDGSTRIALMERPGTPEVGGFGYTSDLSLENTYSFIQDATEYSEFMGMNEHGGANGGIVPTGEWSPSWDEVLAPPAYNDFPAFISALPEDVNGTWHLFIRDSASGDVGSFQNARIMIFTQSMATVEMTDKAFEIYPNPVMDVFRIQSQLKIDQVEIYDLTGKSVLIQNNKNQIDVHHLSKGIYIAIISSGDMKESIKIIKN